MTLLDQNIDILTQHPGHWIGGPKDGEILHDFIGEDDEGNELFLINDEIRLIKKDTEFNDSNMPNNYKKELIFAVGINSIEEIQKLIQNMSKESFLIIVEPSMSFFNHALNKKDLSFFNSLNVILFADDLSNFELFLDHAFSTNMIYYLKNIKFYFTHYYRNYDLEKSISIIRKIKESTQYHAMIIGNSTEDSLTGFKHNMNNIKYLSRSKDVSHLKNRFENTPAVVVAAGPSLNKNIKQLKTMKNRAVIIAVDTIASRLCEEGIIPDFICSIEREEITYTSFYENKVYPLETTMIAPLLLYPKIFEEFKGDIVIPLRENVGEFIWMQETFGFTGDNSISMGLSCAHVAFGFAEHIGASPIILVGQDLAFGSSKEESHASGTIYDNKEFTSKQFSTVEETFVDGYYGDDVSSTDIWISFRRWFEKEILEKNLFVINATEGGARIANTQQISLNEVISEYCAKEIEPIKDVMKRVGAYPISEDQMKITIDEQKKIFVKLKLQFDKQLNNIKRLKINNALSEKQLYGVLEKLQKTDQLFEKVMGNWLLRHNLQPIVLTSIWKLYDIEQILSTKNLNRNKEVQIEFLTMSVLVLNEIIWTLGITSEGF